MMVTVHFYSYFKELTGCALTVEEIVPGGTIAELQQKLCARFPRCVVRRHPCAHQVCCTQLHVQTKLVLHVVVHLARTEYSVQH